MRERKARALAAVAAVAVSAFAAPSPASAAGTPAPWREWVGKVSASRNYIAVAVREQRVEVYVCDGHGHAWRFLGTRAGDDIDLVSLDGSARVRATIRAQQVSGRLTLRGRELRFRAARAARYGGLFTLHKRPGGRIVGGSLGGARYRVRVDQRSGRATGVLIRPDGRRLRLDSRLHRHRSRYLDFRMIQLNDGAGRGNRTATSRIGSRELIDPSCVP